VFMLPHGFKVPNPVSRVSSYVVLIELEEMHVGSDLGHKSSSLKEF
jgi:hypothetical protein